MSKENKKEYFEEEPESDEMEDITEEMVYFLNFKKSLYEYI